MNHFIYKRQAFTLLEILIISAILALFTGTMLANYNNFNQQKNLEREVNRIVDVLSLAKSKAQSGDVYYDCSFSGTDEFSGYTVDLTETSYNFQQCCRDIVTKNQTSCGSPLQTFDLSTNVTNSAGSIQINFFPLAEGASTANFDIRNNLVNKCITVQVLANGLITTSDISQC